MNYLNEWQFVFPDSIQLLSENGRKRHANLLIIIAGADGELVREEIAAIESRTAKRPAQAMKQVVWLCVIQ